VSLLEETYEKHINKDISSSGYARLFANRHDKLARFCRSVHAAVIKSGNDLENLVFDFCNIKNKFKNHTFNGQFMNDVDAFVLKYKINKTNFSNGKGADVDAVIFKKDKILVCELKDGENFDTKKSAGEVDKLQAVCAFLKQKDSLNRKVEPVIVLWNCNDLSTASFKDKRGQAMLKTGSDFAKIVSIDYNSLNAVRDEKNRKNLSYAMRMLEEIRSDEAVV
tara:strand:+ start:206 stop:871 length:666 start_codon:yes stop_codon:yes gene_type:complete